MQTLSEQRKEKSNLITSGSVLVGIPIAYFGLIMLLNYLNMRPTITDRIHPYFPTKAIVSIPCAMTLGSPTDTANSSF